MARRRLSPFIISNYAAPYDYGVYNGGGYRAYQWPFAGLSADQLIMIGATPVNPLTLETGEQDIPQKISALSVMNLTNPTEQSGSATVTDTPILPAVGGKMRRTYFMIQASGGNDEILYVGLGGPGNLELYAGMDFTPITAPPQGSIWIRRSNNLTGIGNFTIVQALAVIED